MNAQSRHQIHSNTVETLELPDQEFKTTMINILRLLSEKVDNTQE